MPDHDPAGDTGLDALRQRLRDFAAARDWEQFHTPKNLAMALACEAAEIMEHFLWLDGAASGALTDAKRDEVGEELADVCIYLVRLADKLDIDLLDAANAKVARNAVRYPADKVRGRAVKYSEIDGNA
ncbi:MAG: nucleotide pyrophosphohydrolase [Gammaproteobacteria bacterium]